MTVCYGAPSKFRLKKYFGHQVCYRLVSNNDDPSTLWRLGRIEKNPSSGVYYLMGVGGVAIYAEIHSFIILPE